MPNWTFNLLTIAGEPEYVEAFSVFNAQSLRSYGMSMASVGADAAMNPRNAGDLSFFPVRPVPRNRLGTRWWGVKWDVAGDSDIDDELTVSAAGMNLTEVPFRKRLQLQFSTPWTHPQLWFDAAVERFPDVSLVMSSDDSEESGKYYLCLGHEGSVEHEVIEVDRSNYDSDDDDQVERMNEDGAELRKNTHEQRLAVIWQDPDRPGSGNSSGGDTLSIAIHRDRADYVEHEIQRDPALANTPIRGMWAPILHAAHAVSANTFATLVAMGADPRAKSPEGLGVMDFVLDARADDPLLERRARIIELLAQRDAAVLDEPLATGIRPIELAARFGMSDILRALLPRVRFEGSTAEVVAPAREPSAKSSFPVQISEEDLKDPAKAMTLLSQILAEQDDVEDPPPQPDNYLPRWVRLAADEAVANGRLAILEMVDRYHVDRLPDVARCFLVRAMNPRRTMPGDERVVAAVFDIVTRQPGGMELVHDLLAAHLRYEQEQAGLGPSGVKVDAKKREVLEAMIRREQISEIVAEVAQNRPGAKR